MREIRFPTTDEDAILRALRQALDEGIFAKMISIQLDPRELRVDITKLATSTIRYQRVATDSGLYFKLLEEKIALVHRPLRREVQAYILAAVAKAGGSY